MIENEVLKALQCCRNADCEKCPCLTCELCLICSQTARRKAHGALINSAMP